jgi:hypothetical protein
MRPQHHLVAVGESKRMTAQLKILEPAKAAWPAVGGARYFKRCVTIELLCILSRVCMIARRGTNMDGCVVDQQRRFQKDADLC